MNNEEIDIELLPDSLNASHLHSGQVRCFMGKTVLKSLQGAELRILSSIFSFLSASLFTKT